MCVTLLSNTILSLKQRSMASLLRMVVRSATMLVPFKSGQQAAITSTMKTLTIQAVETSRWYSRTSPSDSDGDSDSDSEDVTRKEKGASSLWRRKMRTFHGLLDLNNDGVVSFDDFRILRDRFVSLAHLSEEEGELLLEALRVVWEDQWGYVHPYNLVTTEQYLENMHHVINDRSQTAHAYHFLRHLFQAVDNDKDGRISVKEFTLFFKCLGLTDKDAQHTFTTIDVNSDGLLSSKEFVKMGRNFFVTDDESHPSKVFWGPLIIP